MSTQILWKIGLGIATILVVPTGFAYSLFRVFPPAPTSVLEVELPQQVWVPLTEGEDVCMYKDVFTWRVETPDGWLVYAYQRWGGGRGVAMHTVKDPSHTWQFCRLIEKKSP